MENQDPRSVNYYLLHRNLHPAAPEGYQQTVVSVIINKNTTKNRDRFLFIKEFKGFWGFPKQNLETESLTDSFFDTLVKNLGENLGFKGLKIIQLKPRFTQFAHLFNFERQNYNQKRSEDEIRKGRPGKGKVYHVVFMEYKGPDEIPIEPDNRKAITVNYRWVTESEGRGLIDENKDIAKEKYGKIGRTEKFLKTFFERTINAYNRVKQIYSEENPYQNPLL